MFPFLTQYICICYDVIVNIELDRGCKIYQYLGTGFRDP